MSDKDDNSDQNQHQQDAGYNEDCQVTSGLLFLLIPECQVGAENALTWKENRSLDTDAKSNCGTWTGALMIIKLKGQSTDFVQAVKFPWNEKYHECL